MIFPQHSTFMQAVSQITDFFATQDWAIENGPSLRQKVVDCYRSGLAEWILVYQYGQSNIKGALDENYELYRYDEKYDLSLFKRK